MKIALVIPRFDPHVGGAERWTWDFAARLLRHGHELHAVAEAFADSARDPLPGVMRHEVPRALATASGRRFGFAAGAERVLRRLPVDVIHDMGHGWHADLFMPHGGTRGGSFRQNLLLAPPALRWAKHFAASLLPRYRTFRALERRQYVTDGSRLFIALSQMVRCDMVQFHGLPAELIRVVYNGVDTDRFTPRHAERHREPVRRELGIGDEVLFLLVAHNFELKGVGPAIESVTRIARVQRDLRLVVIGKDRAGPYERLARRLGCGDLVQFVGAARDSVPYFAAADVYLHPTYYDPCSLVVLEALASGLPVITTVHNGAGELVTNGREGFVIGDPADIDAITGAMTALMARDFRAACSRHARRLAEEHDLERNYREMLAVYEEIAAWRQARRRAA